MIHLHQHIAVRADKWRTDNYVCDDYPAIAEVLEWAKEMEFLRFQFGTSKSGSGGRRYLPYAFTEQGVCCPVF